VLGLQEICENVTLISGKNLTSLMLQQDYVMATIAAVPGVCLFGAVWATLGSLQGNLA